MGEGIDPFLTRIQEVLDQLSTVGATPQPSEFVRLTLNCVSEDWQVFVQSILGKDTLPGWDKIWADLQQEKLRRALLKSSISGSSSNGSKVVKEEENVTLASKVLVRGKGSRERRRRTYLRSCASGVASLATTVPSVLSERRTKQRSRTKQQHMLR